MTVPTRYWYCGIATGHRHDTEQEAWQCIADHSGSPIGICPICGSPGRLRERRINGNDICENGHTYLSSQAIEGSKGRALKERR